MTNQTTKTTTVLWASRHPLTPEQIEGLKKVAGTEITVHAVDKTFSGANEILEEAKGAKILAVVLPPALLSDLMANKNDDQVVVMARNKRVLVKQDDGSESKVQFVYDGWQVIDACVYQAHIVK